MPVREYYQKNLERCRTTSRLNTQARRARLGLKSGNTHYKSYLADPEQRKRYAARQKVAYQIRKGTIVRGPCEIAGCLEIAHAHHDDYDKPLEVRWFCRTHHTELHNLIKGREATK